MAGGPRAPNCGRWPTGAASAPAGAAGRTPVSEPPSHLHAVTSAAGRLDRSAVLAGGLPAVFAGTAFDPADPALAGVCTAGRTLVLRTGALPVPMQREISWWVAT